jgi:hypothetical protein
MKMMRSAPAGIVLGLLALLATPVGGESSAAADPPELATLFPRRAGLSAPPGRLARLELPPEVVAACRADLSDLRIVGSDGREVPFLVLEGLAPDQSLEVREVVRPELLEVERHTEGRDPGPDLQHETYELSAPPAAPPAERWDLVLASDRRELVRRVDVSLAGTGPEARSLWRGSVFRLTDPRRERLRIPLPAVDANGGADGDERRLVVTIEGEEGGFLDPAFRYERVREVPGAERARVALDVLESRSRARRTELELARPHGLVPDRLVLETATPALERRVEVWDEGPGAVEAPLARATLVRLPGPEGIEDLEVAIAPPRGDRLRLVVHDGDSPPLEDLRVTAAVRRPALLFALPASAGGSATLYFGGGRAFRPRYDLADLAPALPAAATEARAAERLYDPARAVAARLGATSENPRFDPAPALAFAMHPSAALDPAPWRWRRPLAAKPSEEGLVRLDLGLEELAFARADRADLRIVDGEERQWAYLLEEGGRAEPHAVEVADPETDDGVSRYEIALPASPAVIEGLTLEIAAPFFDRPFTLLATRGDAEATLARGRLVLPPRDPRPVDVRFPAARVDSLTLEVEDGNDAPLDVVGATGWFPAPDLYFAAPPGDYALLVGHPDAEAPRYELARVRDVVLAATAGAADAAPLEENPAYRRGARWLAAPGAQKLLLWGALVLAVVVLALFTLALARREKAP